MEISKIKLKKAIFEEIQKHNFTIVDEKQIDGYYLFNFGKNSVWNFRIKECKGWLCGLWIVEQEDKTKYNVNIFAQREVCIDKFKPSCSNICSEFVVNKKMSSKECHTYFNYTINFADFLEGMCIIRALPNYSKWIFSGAIIYENPIQYILSDFWNHKVYEPIKNFYTNKIEPLLVKTICNVYNFVLPKSKVNITLDARENNWSPRYFIKLNFTNKTSEKSRFNLYQLFAKKCYDKTYENYFWQVRFYQKMQKLGYHTLWKMKKNKNIF